MHVLHAAILGLVEGITEYLPVSSTGHLILTSALLYGPDQPATAKQALDTFEIVIQGGAILAVLGLYWPRVQQMTSGLLGKDAAGLRLLGNILTAFMPAALLGLVLHKRIEATLFRPGPVLGALALGGLVMILIGGWQRRIVRAPAVADSAALEQMTWKQALLIGGLQCLSLWPGTSRSMVTIVGGMLVGLQPQPAAEFSFLLALPTLGAACAYSALKDIAGLKLLGVGATLTGLCVATVAATVTVKLLVSFLNRHGLAPFGWYRLGLSAVMGLLIWQGWVQVAR